MKKVAVMFLLRERAYWVTLFANGTTKRVHTYLLLNMSPGGSWDDEHGWAYWQPYFSTIILLALKGFGRI